MSVLFHHTADSMTWIPSPQIDEFLYFYDPSPLERDIIFKESLFDCTYVTGCITRFSEKTQRSIRNHCDS